MLSFGVNGVAVALTHIRDKQLTNVRASGSDDAIKLTPPRLLTLEQALEFIDDDELVEVTPVAIRSAISTSRSWTSRSSCWKPVITEIVVISAIINRTDVLSNRSLTRVTFLVRYRR